MAAVAANRRTEDEIIKLAKGTRHFDGCPVQHNPELAGRVETWKTVKPARLEKRDGFEFPVPPQPMTVVHCCECGSLTYHKE